MIGAQTLAALCMVGVVLAVPAIREDFKCPDQDENSTAVLVANPANCSTYYECDNGRERLLPCSIDTFFSSKYHVCTSKKDSDCPGAVVLEVVEEEDMEEVEEFSWDERDVIASGDGVNYTCPDEPDNTTSTYYPDVKNCSQFYECSNARPVLLSCPKRLYFNSRLCVCTQPKKSGCTQPDDDGDMVALADAVLDILTDEDWQEMKESLVRVYSGSGGCKKQ